jgi:PAS domain S-box-containing protein
VLSTTCFSYFFAEPIYSFEVSRRELPYFVIFVAFAAITAWFADTLRGAMSHVSFPTRAHFTLQEQAGAGRQDGLRLLPIATALCAAAIFTADTLTPTNIAVSSLYAIVVLMAARFGSAQSIVRVAVGCGALTVLSYALSPPGGPELGGIVDTGIGLSAIGLTTLLAVQRGLREARIRRLVDANIIGVFIWDLQGQILEANDAFLRMVGYDHEDLMSGRLHRTRMTPPEWRDQDAWMLAQLKTIGTIQPIEKEYFRKDGSRVPILVGHATFEERGSECVAFVLDLTERKRSEAEARESERRYGEVQIELAHANRLATMGQLTASIAHEVNQPFTAARINAAAGLRFLSRDPPDLEEVREALERAVNDANRGGEIIGRIRALIKKAPPQMDRLAINDAILEVVALTHIEAVKNRVSVRTQLAEGLPPVEMDRVQLQQVILNLIVNAIEAMSEQNEAPRELLLMSANAEPDGVLVAVRDSGPRLAPEHLERLFEAFYTTKASGMGMGLSICRSIIEAHGGRLWAAANETCGANFQFTVPAHPDTAF